MAGWACQFTPRVSLEPPQALLLEIAGSLRYFGGRWRFLERLRAGLSRLGFEARIGEAPAPRAALWLARGNGARLEAQAVAVLGLAPAARALLADLGIKTLGGLLRLPREGIARRFGQGLLEQLDQACGRVPEAREFFVPPARFAARLELPAPVLQAENALFAARRLLAQMEGFLAARQAGVRAFSLALLHEDAPATEVKVGLATPGRAAEHFARLLRERLGALALRAPVEAIRIEAGDIETLLDRSKNLFDDRSGSEEGWLRLIERLQARLGSGAVHGLDTHEDHRPERAFRHVVLAVKIRIEKQARDNPRSRALCGCSSRRAGSPRASSRCWRGPSASSRAGGTAPRRGATTSSPAAGKVRSHGSTARGRGAGSCMATSPEVLPPHLPAYAELHCVSNFSFLRGASHPEELVARAAALGYAALALTDECSLAGIVRAHVAAREAKLKLIVGSELRFDDGLKLVLLAPDRAAYGALCALITAGRRRAKKGAYALSRHDVELHLQEGLLALCVPGENPSLEQAAWVRERFPGRSWLAAELHHGPNDFQQLKRLEDVAGRSGLPLVAAGDVHMHLRSRRRLQDALSAIRLRKPVAGCGGALYPNGERHLRLRGRLARLYPAELLKETIEIADRCGSFLDELRYEYPEELVPPGATPASHLRKLAFDGAQERFPQGVPSAVTGMLEHELALIAELRYEAFFLTVHDTVRFARSRGILCQGRGSAANSAVCYCLGITEVDPENGHALFERFVSRERNEPPDIDVDFEHERREEVIQYLYAKYGRERAALAATVISYRPKSALRDLCRVLEIEGDFSKLLSWWDGRSVLPARVEEAGLDPQSVEVRNLLALAGDLIGFPRHLSQHVGGFVISRGPLAQLVPVENAAMEGRSVIQWDKDDLESLGLLKVDVLALGMLSALRRALVLLLDKTENRSSWPTFPVKTPRCTG